MKDEFMTTTYGESSFKDHRKKNMKKISLATILWPNYFVFFPESSILKGNQEENIIKTSKHLSIHLLHTNNKLHGFIFF